MYLQHLCSQAEDDDRRQLKHQAEGTVDLLREGGDQSACERGFSGSAMYLKGCARQWGCNCAACIAWHQRESTVWRTAVQSVDLDTDAANRMAASHSCLVRTGSVHHDILYYSERGAVAATTSAYALVQLTAQ